MDTTGVVFLQRINKAKLQEARKLRRIMTEAENALWRQLRRKNLIGIKFRRQQIIEGFIADFFCQQLKLVIEVDGGIHSTEERKKMDDHRRKVFEARGLQELRFSNEDVLDHMPLVLEKIRCLASSMAEGHILPSLIGEGGALRAGRGQEGGRKVGKDSGSGRGVRNF